MSVVKVEGVDSQTLVPSLSLSLSSANADGLAQQLSVGAGLADPLGAWSRRGLAYS